MDVCKTMHKLADERLTQDMDEPDCVIFFPHQMGGDKKAWANPTRRSVEIPGSLAILIFWLGLAPGLQIKIDISIEFSQAMFN